MTRGTDPSGPLEDWSLGLHLFPHSQNVLMGFAEIWRPELFYVLFFIFFLRENLF